MRFGITATFPTTVTAATPLSVLPGPQIAITNVASPLSLPEPGGNFTFTVAVSNPSTADPVTVTGLTDNTYGDLTTRAGSACGSLIGVILAPGTASPPCSFTGSFTGRSGDSQTDTVTVTGVDGHGVSVSAAAAATVTLAAPVLPSIALTKAANPSARPAPGGIFTFTLQVFNSSSVDPVTITAFSDAIYGDLATRPGSTCGSLIGSVLAPGASSPCSFAGPFKGRSGDTQTDTTTVTARDSKGHGATATATATISLTDNPSATGDFNGDGISDAAVFRPSTGTWYVSLSGGTMVAAWGAPGDIPVPGDYKGDGKADMAVFRPPTGTWYVSLSGGGTTTAAWGAPGDVPVPGDYDGDGKADMAVFRPSSGTWYVSLSGGGTMVTAWGAPGDIPVPGDYDGDGKADMAVFRPSSGTWYISLSGGGGTTVTSWGTSGDIPV